MTEWMTVVKKLGDYLASLSPCRVSGRTGSDLCLFAGEVAADVLLTKNPGDNLGET